MNISRRTILKSAAIGAATAIGSAVTRAPALAESDTVKVASLHDLSGAVDVYGIPSHNVHEGRYRRDQCGRRPAGQEDRAESIRQSIEHQNYPRYAQQAALEDKVVMLQGSITGASREATRPVLRRYNVPFVYGTIYEGGLCELNAISVNTGSDQQAVPLLEWSFKNLGKKVFYIGADYNAPRNIGIWTHYLAGLHGGEVVGDDYYPLDVTDFSTAISKNQAAKPD
jgi:urea transport system substrate-binding protein